MTLVVCKTIAVQRKAHLLHHLQARIIHQPLIAMNESYLTVMKTSTAVVYLLVAQTMQKARKVLSEGAAGPLGAELVHQVFANKLQRIFAKPVRIVPI
ncbi:hypothetical protein CIK06_18115 [Plantactinospora sp. KBS50]|nr:hypothetical protein CIK06_18115 [Plantactinospora sp. KBS50]